MEDELGGEIPAARRRELQTDPEEMDERRTGHDHVSPASLGIVMPPQGGLFPHVVDRPAENRVPPPALLLVPAASN